MYISQQVHDVKTTSMRRHEVASTLIQRYFKVVLPAGIQVFVTSTSVVSYRNATILLILLAEHIKLEVVHCPDDWHVMIMELTSLSGCGSYWVSHWYCRVSPSKLLPGNIELFGTDSGSPQSNNTY